MVPRDDEPPHWLNEPPPQEEIAGWAQEDLESVPDWADMESAKDEAENWGDEKKLKGIEQGNKERALKLFGLIVPIFMGLFAAIFFISIFSWSWHYVTPECWHWLKGEQLKKIQSVVFSGAIGAVVSGYAQKHFIK